MTSELKNGEFLKGGKDMRDLLKKIVRSFPTIFCKSCSNFREKFDSCADERGLLFTYLANLPPPVSH